MGNLIDFLNTIPKNKTQYDNLYFRVLLLGYFFEKKIYNV